jgi:multidrug efflux pump subunit AcrB
LDITRFAIEKDRITFTLLIVLLFAGISAYLSMPRSEDPGYIVRVAMVQTFFPGASPDRIELLVTDKLEKSIQQIPEVDFVKSTSRDGLSVIYVTIKDQYKNMRPIWDNLRRKVDDAKRDLPEGVVGPFVNDEFGDVFGTIYTLTGDGFSYHQLKEIAKQIQNELLLADQVAKVDIIGAQDEWVVLEYDNARLAQMGISPKMLIKMLQERNIILPGGDIRTQYEKIVIEPTGNFESIDDIGRSVVQLPDSSEVVRLEDIVTLKRMYIDPPKEIMHTNGTPSLALAISLRSGGNIVELGKEVDPIIERALKTYPVGISIEQFMFAPDIVNDKINNFLSNLYQAIAIVALVMLISLGMRTGLIVATLIPTTMLITFYIMSLWGVWLEQVSLASLIIALGILVDNAIVMAESVMVQMRQGKSAKDAAIAAGKELRIPLLTSSLTTIAAFLPIILAESPTSENVASLFKVITITLLISWFIALTLIPLLCVKFMRVDQAEENFNTPFYKKYREVLLYVLQRPWKTMMVMGVIFLISLQCFKLIPSVFFPANERPTFTVELKLPQGAPIERTLQVVDGVEQFIAQQDNIENYVTYIGDGGPKFVLPYAPEPPNIAYAIMVVNGISLKNNVNVLMPAIEKFIIQHYPDVSPTLRPLTYGPDAWPPVAIRISGRDNDELFTIAEKVKAHVASIPGAKLVTDDWGGRSKKIVLNIDEARAQLAGVTHEDIAISTQAFLTGIEASDYREGDELIPIMIRSAQPGLISNDITSINVYSQATGKSVPLTQVATPELLWQPGNIERRNRLRTVTVEALIEPDVTAKDITQQIRPYMEEQAKTWPFGFSWEFGGEEETAVKSQAAIVAKLPIAALLIIFILIAQFNSITQPLIILCTIPLSIIGVVIGLLVTGAPFDFMTLLGVISLAGIIINNAIVLLDRIRIEIEENALPAAQAIIEAAQQRLRPILLTTATTVAGMIPLWIGGGLMWRSMAIAIIFGISIATILTLGVVPVLYSLFFKVKYKQQNV